MTIPTLDSVLPEFDRDFWRIRTRLLKRANGTSLAELAPLEAKRSLDRATHWTNGNQGSSAAGERRRAERLHLIAQFETYAPPVRASILRRRASELRCNGQADAAAELAAEANDIVALYLENLGTEALQIQNASNVLQFARASLSQDPNGPHARRLRKLIASAQRTVSRAANPEIATAAR